MQLTVISIDDALARIQVTGHVDQSQVGQGSDPLKEKLGEQGYSKTLLIDLSLVDLIDSSGIGWLLATQKQCRGDGGRLIIHSPSMTVRNVLKVLNLYQVFEIVNSLAEAEKLVS